MAENENVDSTHCIVSAGNRPDLATFLTFILVVPELAGSADKAPGARVPCYTY